MDDGFELYELLPSKSRPFSEYGATYSMLGNYDIEKALQVIDAEDWQNAEPFLNPFGSQQVTLVHFAACRGNLRMWRRAADLRAPMYATDEFGRCALHYAAGQGHVDVVQWLLEHSAAGERSNGPRPSTHPQLSLGDYHARTPLHQAVEAKHVAVVNLLVDSGANVNACDKQGVTPFLLAHVGVVRNDLDMMSRYERIVDILALAEASVNVIHQLTGQSVLHHAVTLNSCRATDRVIKCGGNSICYRRGRRTTTPVHLAARFGYHKVLQILLKDLPSSLVDKLNENGWSALHLAALLGNLECVRALVDKGGNLARETPHGSTVIDLLSMFKHNADLAAFFTDMLVAKVRLVDPAESSAQIVHEISLDFQALTPEGQPQMAVVSALMKALPRSEQITILQHPVLEVYLGLKWSRVRYVFYSFAVVHLVFAGLLTLYAMVLLRANFDSSIPRRMLLFSACISIFQNLLQFCIEPKRYCKQFEHWLSLICVMMSIAVAAAGEFTPSVATSNHEDKSRARWQPSWTLHFTSVAILLAWIQIMLLAGRLPAWGFYALILSTVLKNVLKVLFIGIWIIISFALSFSLLFHKNDQFDNPFNAFVKTVAMMTGEYDYETLFGKCNSTTSNFDPDDTILPVTSKIIFLLFVLLASIVLMNLMIGLAVNDIQGLVKEGRFSRLLKQAEFIAYCERMATAPIFQSRFVPNCLTKFLQSNVETTKNLLLRWGHKRDLDVSEKMWKNLLQLSSENRDPHSGKHDHTGGTRMPAAQRPLPSLEFQSNCCRCKHADCLAPEPRIQLRREVLSHAEENLYDYVSPGISTAISSETPTYANIRFNGQE